MTKHLIEESRPSTIVICAYMSGSVANVSGSLCNALEILGSLPGSGRYSAHAQGSSGRVLTQRHYPGNQSYRIFADEMQRIVQSEDADEVFVECRESRGALRWMIRASNAGFIDNHRAAQPLMCVSIRDRELEHLGAAAASEFVRRISMHMFDHTCVDTGLVDIGTEAEVQEGTYYAFEGARVPYRWHRHVNHYEWIRLSCDQRRKMCRGVYWGTYLGKALRDRVESAELMEAFKSEMARDPQCRPFVHVGTHGGCLYGLSGWPLTIHERVVVPDDTCPPYTYSKEAERAAILRSALRHAEAIL